MIDLNCDQIRASVQPLLDTGAISGRLLLDRMRVLDESSRKTAAYADHRYAPFYYHLGKFLKAESMVEVGFNLGLLSACFLKSCKTLKKYVGFQERRQEYYSPRLGTLNVKANYKGEFHIHVGNFTDTEFTEKISPNSLDLVILNDEVGFDKHLTYLDFFWDHLSANGIIVAEYIVRHTPARDAFRAFCESKSREPTVFETRYGTGLVQK